MQPIFNEFIKFLNDKTGKKCSLNAGIYWLDNGFVKAFTKDGELHKLYKYKVFDDLSISFEKHKDYVEESFETWEETIVRMSDHLDAKVNESLAVIKDVCEQYSDSDMWVLTSTGKDSTVVVDLVKRVIPDIKVMFNNTSLDCADSYKLVKSHPEWIVTNPKVGFYQWCKAENFIPTRFSRACCSIFKEGASIKYFSEHNIDKLMLFMGVRNAESTARANRQYIEHNPKWTNPNWMSCLPIRTWDDLDIWLYMLREKLEINTKYNKGYTRVGCGISCPYYTKSTWVLDKYWYSNMYDRWHKTLNEVFIQNKRWSRMNCTVEEYHSCWNGGLIRISPTEEVIQEMMNYTGLDRDTAEKYFNKTCCECGSNVRHGDVLGMNYKYLSLNTEKVYCKRCLKKLLGIKESEWNENIARFKDQGCKLF